jgi:hypothetical protein
MGEKILIVEETIMLLAKMFHNFSNHRGIQYSKLAMESKH